MIAHLSSSVMPRSGCASPFLDCAQSVGGCTTRSTAREKLKKNTLWWMNAVNGV
mgnify:CR=1 FL=1